MASSSPAMAVWTRWGKASKSSTLVVGRRVSRPEVAGEVLAWSAGSRSRRPKPSSRRIWPTPSTASRVLISYTDRPSRRSWMTRARGAVFFRGVLAAGFARRSEQGKLPGAQVAGQRIQRGRGVAEPAGGLVQGGTLVQVGAQRFVAPLVGLGRVGEQLPSLALGRFGCHGADLSEVACWPTVARPRQECPGWWWIVLVHSHPEHDRSA